MKQETFEEFLKREGYPEGRIQEVWEDGAKRGAEWQEKRMYSEDEVLNLLIEMNSWPTTFEGKEDITEWFEKFKKEITMGTVTKTIEEINNGAECPLPISVIPNEMGINLVSVNSISWTKQEDGQLVSLTINFLPKN